MRFRPFSRLFLIAALSGVLSGSLQAAAVAADTSPRAASVNDAGDRESVGTRTVYRIEYRSASETRFSRVLSGLRSHGARPAPGLDNRLFSSVQGTFSFTVISAEPDGALLAFRMEDGEVSLTSNGVENVQQAKAAREALRGPCLVKRARSGKITSLWLGAASDIAQSFVRAVLAETQATVPDDVPGRRSWETEEEDPTGRYLARYQISSPGARSAGQRPVADIRKTKLRYLSEPERREGGAVTVTPSIQVSGSSTGKLDIAARELLAVDGEESQQFVLNGRTVAKARNRLRLSLVQRARADDSELRMLQEASARLQRSAAPTSLFVRPSREAGDAAIATSELGSATAEELLAALRSAEAEPPDTRRTKGTDVYLKLKALAYLHPESCPALGAELSRAKPGSLAFEILPLALSKAGTAAAQSALVSVIRQRSQESAVVKALVTTLANVGAITPATEDALSDLAYGVGTDPEIAGRARLVLGAQAGSLAASSPERAAAIVKRLLRALDEATNTDDRVMLLLALGNSGSPLAFPAVQRGAGDASPNVRAAVMSALRFVETSQAEALLLHGLESDPQEFVRSQAAASLRFRKMTKASAEVHRRVFASQASDLVRLAVLQNLWNARGEFPDVKKLVKRAAASDRSENVRKEAARLVAPSGDTARGPEPKGGR